ncbi:MAG: hypothetical protein HQ591_02145 [candidate division Zixibacteria bacterium]|nr:hypothetical protein [Candidatus Tariuqbacter arcticus]
MRLNKVFLTVLFLLVLASFTFAQTTIHWAVSGKLFLANWENTYTDYVWDETEGDYVESNVTESMGTKPMMGLTVGLKRAKIGLSLTLFTGSGWGVEEEWTEVWGDYTYMEFFDYEFSRTDLIFAASYSLTPRISLFAGYKNISLEEKYLYREKWDDGLGDADSLEAEYTYDYSLGGVGFGVAFNYPVMPKLIPFANIGYFILGGEIEEEGLTTDLSSGNVTFELGANYVLTSNIIASASYRFESFATTAEFEGEEWDQDSAISGPSITLTYFK